MWHMEVADGRLVDSDRLVAVEGEVEVDDAWAVAEAAALASELLLDGLEAQQQLDGR
jgi:hypothetical protein